MSLIRRSRVGVERLRRLFLLMFQNLLFHYIPLYQTSFRRMFQILHSSHPVKALCLQ